MKTTTALLGVVAALIVSSGLLSVYAASADKDTSWPCVQRLVNEISIGQMWPHVLEKQPEAQDFIAQEDVHRLISYLSLRRVSSSQAQQLVKDFATKNPVLSRQRWGSIFSEVLDSINESRAEIISGIERYATSQQTRAQQIDQLRTDIAAAIAEETPDYDNIDALEESLDWNERIHRDREQSLLYVCESPVLLEKHAYALAQILLQQVSNK